MLCRPCLDWSERRPHLAGRAGAAIADLCTATGLDPAPAAGPLRRNHRGRTCRIQRSVRRAHLISESNFDTALRVETLKVRDIKDVEEVVRAAIASEQPLEIIGHGSKRAIGHPMATNAVLDVSVLNAVTSYEPNELIITVAGRRAARRRAIADRCQEPAIRLRADGHLGAARRRGRAARSAA